MRIPGYMRPGPVPEVPARPYVEAALALQGSIDIVRIQFLIDTGADDTILHPRDVRRLDTLLQPDPPLLASTFDDHPGRRSIGGVGGRVYIIPASVRLFFRIEGSRDRLRHDCRVWVAEPTATNRRLPSLLGRDLLQLFRLTVDYEAAPPVLLERS